ncbi:uncharacterized protein LOC125678326 isoform X2 [Ostrea edulis]|uniref:uncharacterized protein LOC125678326 isoform X2 n=1 Tax=Ostrea edulis TaxID=37623 RepID=UPI002095F552|nr:uncharacterized protein LOC125678326 isoform X2 [Ostrea edulis]
MLELIPVEWRNGDSRRIQLIGLSEVAGVRMTENNPSIADLSDVNRPINLGEEFSEIYDNEYTEMFLNLKKVHGDNKNYDVHGVMLKTAERCNSICRDWEKKQFAKILTVFQLKDVKDRNSLPKGVVKHIKDLRISLLKNEQSHLEKEFYESLKTEGKQSLEINYGDDNVKKYISHCLSFFWRACIQTPPLYFDFNVQKGTPFDSAVHRKCTVNGPNVDYTVWPVVYLHERGPVLVKGIVQCQKGNGKSLETSSNSAITDKAVQRVEVGKGSERIREQPPQTMKKPDENKTSPKQSVSTNDKEQKKEKQPPTPKQ